MIAINKEMKKQKEFVRGVFHKGWEIECEAENVYVVKFHSEEDSEQLKSLEAKRRSANRDAAQQAFLLGMLVMNGYDIILQKLYKKASKTIQMFKVLKISKDNQIIYSQQEDNSPGMDLKTKRRNNDAQVNEIMLSLIGRMNNCMIEFKNGKKSTKRQQLRRLSSITINGVFFGLDRIETIGKSINDYFMVLNNGNRRDIIVEAYNLIIINIFSM